MSTPLEKNRGANVATFLERLSSLKESNNLLQKDIAKELNIPLRTYQRYEYGEREPPLSALITIADYFDISLDYLVGRSDDPVRR